MKIICPTEYQECKSFFANAQYNPVLREYLIKIVNEGQRSMRSGMFLKLIGLRSGLPDYFLPVPNDKYIGLWLEMKRRNQINVKKRDNQNEWIAKLNNIGHYASYAYGCDHAFEIAHKYLNNKI